MVRALLEMCWTRISADGKDKVKDLEDIADWGKVQRDEPELVADVGRCKCCTRLWVCISWISPLRYSMHRSQVPQAGGSSVVFVIISLQDHKASITM